MHTNMCKKKTKYIRDCNDLENNGIKKNGNTGVFTEVKRIYAIIYHGSISWVWIADVNRN